MAFVTMKFYGFQEGLKEKYVILFWPRLFGKPL